MDKQLQHTKQQFHVLLDRANKRFGKLRELQTRGDHEWSRHQVSYQKTFEAFSRLWQFQLNNRPALLEAGLQRSELGGIANKVGQLYYNYYLRSGDTGALLESYTFYDAVHTRQYFASATGADAPDPAGAARQMRFYARFVVVCLFLNRKQEAMQLLQELQASVSAYLLQFASPDAQEWQLVVNEVTSLLAADVAVPLPRSPGSLEVPYRPPRRCRPTDPAASCAPHRPRLREAVLVSYRPRQVKVAELPLELYRMAQALEWEDSRLAAGALQGGAAAEASSREATAVGVAAQGTSAGSGSDAAPASASAPAAAALAPDAGGTAASAGGGNGGGGGGRSRNPPRQLMYKPTAQQVLGSLLSVTAAMTGTAAERDFVLLYIAADAAGESVAPQPAGAASGRGTPEQAAAEATAGAGEPGQPVPSAAAPVRDAPPCRQLLLAPGHHHAHTQHQHQRQQHHQAGPGGKLSIISSGPNSAASAGGGSAGSGAPGAGPSSGSQSALAASAAAPAAGSAPGPGMSDGLLWVEELLVASRRRLLLVVDSNMAPDLDCLQGREKGPPLLCLQSGTAPTHGSLTDPARYGSLFTMALACPAQALCALCGEADPAPGVLQRLQGALDDTLHRLGRALAEHLAPELSAAATPAAAPPATLAEAGAAAAEATAAAGAPSGAAVADGRAADGDQRGSTVGGAAAEGGSGAASVSVSASGCSGDGAVVDVPGGVGASGAADFTAWRPAFEDALSRRLLLHFAFFRCCMTLYGRGGAAQGAGEGAAAGDGSIPRCFPPLPPAASPSGRDLQAGVLRAAAILGHGPLFGGASAAAMGDR